MGLLFALPSDKTMIDLRHLRFFTVVAEKLGIRRAAEALALRPSTLSYHLQVLEDELGVDLFDRRRGGLELTGAGRSFLERAHRVLFEFERAVTEAGRFGRAEAGRLRDLLQSYRQAFPGVEVFLIEGNRIDLLGRLRDRRLDVVLVAGRLDGERGIEALPLWDERLLAVLPDGHPLVAMGGIRWSQLGRERVIVRTWESGGEIFDFMIGKLAVRGHAPDVVQHVVGRESLINLVGAGYGVTIVSEAAGVIPYPGVRFLPVAEPDAAITVSAGWLPENGNPASRRFVSFLRSQLAARKVAPMPEGVPAPEIIRAASSGRTDSSGLAGS